MDESLSKMEIEKAFSARINGNEGMARVLARRASGLAIREFFKNKELDHRGLSLNTLLKDEEIRKVLPSTINEALDRLSTRIGMDFQFPLEFDLLLDAQFVIDQLSII
jgi:hypothetical protein